MTAKTTTAQQQGDVHLFQTPDGGEIRIRDGVAEMVPGLQVSAYMSLFGGNDGDDGVAKDNPKQYWGNFIEADPVERLRSRTQYLLRSLPINSANLRKLEEAARLDLAWLLTQRIADDIAVTATIPAVNAVRLLIRVSARGEEHEFNFTQNWKAST